VPPEAPPPEPSVLPEVPAPLVSPVPEVPEVAPPAAASVVGEELSTWLFEPPPPLLQPVNPTARMSVSAVLAFNNE